MFALTHVYEALIGEPPAEGPLAAQLAQPVSEVVIDSRQSRPGALFVALRGEHTDGHLFAADAFAKGAIAAICGPQARSAGVAARYLTADAAQYGDEGQDLPLIFEVPETIAALQQVGQHWRSLMPADIVAVTGSVGKTTTKETIANVLSRRFRTLRSGGNYNNEIGLPLNLLQLAPTHERAVLEMGMYDLGEIRQLAAIARPRIGVVTNIGPTHLERLGTIERIAQAKAELVEALPPANEGGFAILNQDDPLVRSMAARTQARVFTYGLDPDSDVWADEISGEGLEGIRFRFHHGRELLHVHLPMLGRHSVHTALRAAATGLAEGLSWTEIIEGLRDVRGQLRLMVVPGLRGTTIIDDTYNASPTSMLAALNLLEDIVNTEQRAVAVLGDMLELGAYEQPGHEVVGGRAAQVVRKLVTVGPRARWIARGAQASGLDPADIYPTETNQDAIGVLQGLIRSGDVVLVKGSRALGMETIVDALSRQVRPDSGTHV